MSKLGRFYMKLFLNVFERLSFLRLSVFRYPVVSYEHQIEVPILRLYLYPIRITLMEIVDYL